MKGVEGQLRWSCAPGVGEGVEPDDLLCSQGPHDTTVVARCAQWRPQPATSLKAVKRIALSLSWSRAAEDQSAPIPEEITSELEEHERMCSPHVHAGPMRFSS